MDVGDVLAGRYELLEEVGAGGMGRVLRAHDRTLDRTVAVKLLAPHLLGDAEAVGALRAEARLAAAVRHPNVVQVLDAVLDDTDQPAIVMEYVDGPSLGALVPAGGMDLDQGLQVVAAVGSGLAAVHAAGLVHRDVTPANVLIDEGVPRLTDFGIARPAAATATQTIRGSVAYLAPEQASGAPVGPAADLYALGCLATTVLTGRPPFEAEAPVGTIHQHLHRDPPDVRDRRPEIPAAVATTIAAALAKDPGERPPSAAAMLRALGVPPTAATLARPTDDPADLPATTVLAGGADHGAADSTRVLEAGDAGAGAAAAGASDGDDDTDGIPRAALVALGAVAVVAALLGTVALLGDDGAPEVAASPEPAATAAPSPEPSPSPEPPPSPSPVPEQPLTASEVALAAIRDLRTLLVDLRGTDELSAEALEKLDERAAMAAQKLQQGEPNEASKELRELRKELSDRVGEDEVSRAAEEALLTQLLLVEEALDAVPRGEGGGGPPRDDEDDD